MRTRQAQRKRHGEAMSSTPPYLKGLEALECQCILELVGVRCEEGLEGVRYVLWDRETLQDSTETTALPLGVTRLRCSRRG